MVNLVGYFMNLPGRIYAIQLPPIKFDRTKNQTRDSISLELRTQMLKAIIKSPKDAGSAISWSFRIKNILSIVALLLMLTWIYQVPCQRVMSFLHIDFRRLAMYIFSLSIFVTSVLYVFKIELPKNRKPLPRTPVGEKKEMLLPKKKSRKTD